MFPLQDTSVSAEDDGASLSSRPVTVAGGGEDEHSAEVVITPQNIAIQYYRRETIRIATIVIVLSMIDLFITPIDAMLLLPSSVAVSYWLRDTVRFSHGGDLRRCFNRDCSLMYFHICAGAALIVSALDCVVLITNFTQADGSDRATTPPTSTRSPTADALSASTVSHSVSWYTLAIGVNASSFVTLLYGFYCIRKLRRLLELGTNPASAADMDI